MIKSFYNDSTGVIDITNLTNLNKRFDYSVIDLDTNLCFTKGWINFPPKCTHQILLWDSILPIVNKLGIKIQLFEDNQLIYSQDHYTSEGLPQNYFYNNPLDMQFGSWNSLSNEGEYEGLLTISDEDIIYDLGANIGVFTKWALNQANVKHIYAFEPTPELIDYMSKTFEGYSNVTLFDKAIAGENMTAKFFTFESSVSNTLLDFDGKNENYKGYIEVECVNLEQFIKLHQLQPPTLIKMDIESAEYASIKNLSDEFLLNVNQFILEYHENFNGEIWNVIKRFLDLGFKVKVKPGNDLNYKMGTIIFTK